MHTQGKKTGAEREKEVCAKIHTQWTKTGLKERTELKEQTGHKERTTFRSWGLSEEGAGRRNQRTVQVRRSPGCRSV